MTKLEKAIRELMPLELHGQRNKVDWHGQDIELGDTEEFQTIELGINELIEELENAEQRYKALDEHFKNGVAYATKIQEELNELKRDVARFMTMNEFTRLFTDDERDEYQKLWIKLLKVGKQE